MHWVKALLIKGGVARATLGALAVCLAGCGPDAWPAGHELSVAYEAAYSSVGGSRVTFEKSDDAETGAVVMFFMPNGLAPGLGERLGFALRDCSTTDIRCITFGSHAFAAPPPRSKTGDTLQVGGAVFTILKCEPSNGADCGIAHIKSDCRWRDLEAGCGRTAEKPAGALPGTVLVYLLDSQAGVLWWDSSDECVLAEGRSGCPAEGADRLETDWGLLAGAPVASSR